VLDPFFGAGTTGVAAEQLDRDWLGIELNHEFAALAQRRIEEARAGPRAAA
jgi:DNA modification methylase